MASLWPFEMSRCMNVCFPLPVPNAMASRVMCLNKSTATFPMISSYASSPCSVYVRESCIFQVESKQTCQDCAVCANYKYIELKKCILQCTERNFLLLLKNGHTLTLSARQWIGSQNSGACHVTSSAMEGFAMSSLSIQLKFATRAAQ